MVNISIATLDDINGIVNIYHQASIFHHEKLPHVFKEPCIEDEKEFITTCFEDKDLTIFKAEDDNVVCGYLILRIKHLPEKFFISSHKGFIDSIGVDENHKRQGIGQQMIKAAEDYLKSQNVYTMELGVYVFNDSAIVLYKKMGYKTLKLYKSKDLLM